MTFELALRDSADCRIFRHHGDVLQVVQFAEYAQLRELVDPGDEYEPQVRVQALDGTVEVPHYLPHRHEPVLVVHHVEKRGVIFINYYDSLFSGFPRRLDDKSFQTRVDILSCDLGIIPVFLLIECQLVAKVPYELFLRHVLCGGHVEVEDRMPPPVGVHLSGPEPME